MHDTTSTPQKLETRLLLFIFVVFFPLLSIAIVGSYGFAIWLLQIIFGPPTA